MGYVDTLAEEAVSVSGVAERRKRRNTATKEEERVSVVCQHAEGASA